MASGFCLGSPTGFSEFGGVAVVLVLSQKLPVHSSASGACPVHESDNTDSDRERKAIQSTESMSEETNSLKAQVLVDKLW